MFTGGCVFFGRGSVFFALRLAYLGIVYPQIGDILSRQTRRRKIMRKDDAEGKYIPRYARRLNNNEGTRDQHEKMALNEIQVCTSSSPHVHVFGPFARHLMSTPGGRIVM